MIVVWIAWENHPGSIQIYVSIQVQLVLEVSHIDTMHADDVSDSEYMRQVLNILSKELHLYVSHAALSGWPGPLDLWVALKVTSLTSSYPDLDLSRTFGIQGIIDELDGAQALVFDIRIGSIGNDPIDVVGLCWPPWWLAQFVIHILLLVQDAVGRLFLHFAVYYN